MYKRQDLRTTIAGASIPYGYFIFLAGSYAMGTSATVLQVVINPYVTSYELKMCIRDSSRMAVVGIGGVGSWAAC